MRPELKEKLLLRLFSSIEYMEEFTQHYDPLRQYRTPQKLSKLTPEVIHEQETYPANEQKIYSRV
jgi:hypothetical protein